MRFLQDGRPVYTATDLCDYLACGHLVALKRRVAAGESDPERDSSALSEVLANLGAGHEQRHLDALEPGVCASRRSRTSATGTRARLHELRALEAETLAAMGEGYDVIYQPTFFDGRWMGRADFLLRVETPSARWAWSYEAADAKLARRVRSEAILQLCEYSAHLAAAPGNRACADAGDPRRRHRASISRRRVLRLPRNREARFRVGDARRRGRQPIRIPSRIAAPAVSRRAAPRSESATITSRRSRACARVRCSR